MALSFEDTCLAYFDGLLDARARHALLQEVSSDPAKQAVFEAHKRLHALLQDRSAPLGVPLNAQRALADRIPVLSAALPELARRVPDIAATQASAGGNSIISGLVRRLSSMFGTMSMKLAVTVAAAVVVAGGYWGVQTLTESSTSVIAPKEHNVASQLPDANTSLTNTEQPAVQQSNTKNATSETSHPTASQATEPKTTSNQGEPNTVRNDAQIEKPTPVDEQPLQPLNPKEPVQAEVVPIERTVTPPLTAIDPPAKTDDGGVGAQEIAALAFIPPSTEMQLATIDAQGDERYASVSRTLVPETELHHTLWEPETVIPLSFFAEVGGRTKELRQDETNAAFSISNYTFIGGVEYGLSRNIRVGVEGGNAEFVQAQAKTLPTESRGAYDTFTSNIGQHNLSAPFFRLRSVLVLNPDNAIKFNTVLAAGTLFSDKAYPTFSMGAGVAMELLPHVEGNLGLRYNGAWISGSVDRTNVPNGQDSHQATRAYNNAVSTNSSGARLTTSFDVLFGLRIGFQR